MTFLEIEFTILNMENLVKTSLQFDKEQLDYLQRLSAKKKISVAGVVRMIIDDFRAQSDYADFINNTPKQAHPTPAAERG